MTTTDPAIAIAATLAGDADAYAAIVLAFEDELRAFVARRCHDAVAIDEICHDAFVVAFQRLARFDPAQGPFPGWLKGIARNLLLQYLDAARRRAGRMDRLTRLQVEREQGLVVSDDDRLAALRRCLDKLPTAWRDLIDGRYRDEQDIRALAQALGRSASWVTTNLQRARDALRACMVARTATP